MKDVAVIILAAGKGTRMKSDLPKVLHRVAGKSMVVHVTECANTIAPDNIFIVVGYKAELVKEDVQRFFPLVEFAYQTALLGTGDAVKAALPGLSRDVRHVVVLCADVPLIREATLRSLVDEHKKKAMKLSLLAVHKADPHGYGRILTGENNRLVAIREEADASDEEKKITLVNAGIYCFDRTFLEEGIRSITNENLQGEYYLTDLVEIGASCQLPMWVQVLKDPVQVMGVNTLKQLAKAEEMYRPRADELP